MVCVIHITACSCYTCMTGVDVVAVYHNRCVLHMYDWFELYMKADSCYTYTVGAQAPAIRT